VIADGRCPVASILLALGSLPDDHCNDKGRNAIDQARRALGHSMTTGWTEQEWVDTVPIELRGANIQWAKGRSQVTQSSFRHYHQLLTQAGPTTWLDHCVFYLVSRSFSVAVLIVQVELREDKWQQPIHTICCRHIGAEHERHIVIVHTLQRRSGHYECVQYGGQRVFPSRHPLVECLVEMAHSHAPAAAPEVDVEKTQQEASGKSEVIDMASDDTPVRTEKRLERTKQIAKGNPTALPTPARRAPSRRLRHIKKQDTSQSSQSSATLPPQHPSTTSHTAQSSSPSRATSTLAIADPLPSVADIAAHGQLYDFVSFTNVPQWVGICNLVFNQYRIASQDGNREAQTQALVDLLMLPQRVLTKTKRGGASHHGRLIATVKARCRDVGEEIRQRYQCRDPIDYNVQLTVTTTPLVHQPRQPPTVVDTDSSSIVSTDDEDTADEAPQTQPSYRQRTDSRALSTASTTIMRTVTSTSHSKGEYISNEDSEPDATSGDDETTNNVWANRLRRVYDEMGIPPDDPDAQAVRRGRYLGSQGHLQRASKALHSTNGMADLSQPSVQDHMRHLHPALPSSSTIPSLPANIQPTILEDDEVMKKLIRRSNNGACSGPSGWGGNLLSSLVESHICRAGIVALLKDILNGNMSAEARQYLLASRLFGLTKPDGGVRPIAAGELFYRLAGVLAVRNVVDASAKLLSPHQYGIGVSAGCERMVHSMQHSLTDTTKKYAVLKIDISNAFNSCNRAEMLQKLYDTRELTSIYRIADFAYSTPSDLLLQGCDGLSIQSSNGVRQGDPLACLLFCLYMKDVYDKVAQQAKVVLYAYVDDLHIVGVPAEVMKALTALQTLLPAAHLTCNTAKSHFGHFHQHTAPLHSNILSTLAQHNITVHEDWLEVVGAVVGRDEEAIRAGVKEVFNCEGNDAFFRRLQSIDMPVQLAMLLLRLCAVPQLNYLLRCTPPSCIAELADDFDRTFIGSALDKLEVRLSEVTEETRCILQTKLSDGGFGLKSARTTSPAAYLGSLAAARTAEVFDVHNKPACPLPSTIPLTGWIEHSMRLITDATPESADSLPSSPSSFFSYYATAKSSLSSTLQHTLSMQAASSQYEASLRSAKEMRKHDGGASLAHLKAYSAPRASTWKSTVPTGRLLTLTDTQYRIAARLNLRLQPFANMGELPDSCPVCSGKDAKGAIAKDGWHFLSCKHQTKREKNTRHNAIADAIYHTVLTVGGQAVREPRGLSASDGKRPDLQIVFPGVHLLTDVVVVHPLTYARIHDPHKNATHFVRAAERKKRVKYAQVATAHACELLPFAVETTGGMAPDAFALLDSISRAGREHLALWPHFEIERHMRGAIAIAVQKGTAMVMLAGYTAAVAKASASEVRSE
jgi:hypothetical protein